MQPAAMFNPKSTLAQWLLPFSRRLLFEITPCSAKKKRQLFPAKNRKIHLLRQLPLFSKNNTLDSRISKSVGQDQLNRIQQIGRHQSRYRLSMENGHRDEGWMEIRSYVEEEV